jgi:hypothetical protein
MIRALRSRLLEDLHAATESTYRLAVRVRDAGIDERTKARRRRLEEWIREQVRAQPASKETRSEEDLRREAEKQAAYTLLNRLVILRLMEAAGPDGQPIRKPAALTGGWESPAYKAFRQLAPALTRGDDSEGYALLLQLVFEEIAVDLPGVFGPAGVADLIPIPAATLRHAIRELDKFELESCWTDDMTLGWVYQYWNDPEREALDAKINAGGKIEPHEIASKTQMFTERYMVDWLLQNSLGPMWLAMCKKHGWAPQVEADRTLDTLEKRRAEWRAKRDAGEVELTELMPLHTDAEQRWAYYVPQPIPGDAVDKASESVRDLKILDPAVGSGHFLVVALDLLVALYREEGRHRGERGQEQWSDAAIVERILSHNLHGIDLDPRAVQIAAATLWLKAKQVAPDARLKRMNLVASNLRLASLPDSDPALVQLRKEVERETGIPGELTNTIVHALRGADHLGSLLKIDQAVEEALSSHDGALGKAKPDQGGLFTGFSANQKKVSIGRDEARATVLDRLEGFLGRHTSGADLGLRLRGEQLAAGVRFARIVREGTYDVVVANPPYQGTSKLAASKYIQKQYSLGKADLYAAFLVRGLELVREGGVSSMLTMRNWMFIKQYSRLREWLLGEQDVRSLGDFDRGAFENVPDEVVSVAVSVTRRGKPSGSATALCPTPRDDNSRDSDRTRRKRAAILCHVGRLEFDSEALKVVPEWPLVYWWSRSRLTDYAKAAKIADICVIKEGLGTKNDPRYLRRPWEPSPKAILLARHPWSGEIGNPHWVPFIKGAGKREWFEPVDTVVNWDLGGAQIAMYEKSRYGRGADHYFQPGVAISAIGQTFSARLHAYPSIFGHVATSVFGLEGTSPADIVVLLNTRRARNMLSDFNPSIHFLVGDVRRLPSAIPADAADVVTALRAAFDVHESRREPSVEFRAPGPSPWRLAQSWGQAAVDREEGELLPPCIEESDPEPPTDHVSYALGVALGRFDAAGDGVIAPPAASVSDSLPHGVLFLDTTLDDADHLDGLGRPEAALLHDAWSRYGQAISTRSLREWLALEFFKDVHRSMYENRPISWPISSSRKTFVAWVNIHRFNDQSLRVLHADYLQPTLTRLDGELTDLRTARDGADKKAARDAERRYVKVVKARDELLKFIADVEQCADKGPPPTDSTCPPRDNDAPYDPDLDDGVMVNSSALWPLLDPQWKDPKKWWKQLASAKGKKDYDWSHLAMKYWPERVDKKCEDDPSLGVAHGCFWKYHPARAWAWELRLQDEIGPEFRIEEKPYRGDGGDVEHRAAYLEAAPAEALAAVEKEVLRRRGRGKDAKAVGEMRVLEPGLWSVLPEECWELEMRISEKQGAEFRLLAPDEAKARARFEKENPKRAAKRSNLLASLNPPTLYDGADPEDEREGQTSSVRRFIHD